MTVRIYIPQRDVTRAAGCIFPIDYCFDENEAFELLMGEFKHLSDYDRRNTESWFIEGWYIEVDRATINGLTAKAVYDMISNEDPDRFCRDADYYRKVDPAKEECERMWYAVMVDRDDTDWGSGTHDVDEAQRILEELRANGHEDAYIALIEDGVCVGEIDLDE